MHLPPNLDTNGAEESVIVSEVSSFQRLKCMQQWYLGWEKVSCLERCPQFRSVLIEREVPLYNQDTNGAEESVIVSEVSSFQRLKCMQEWYLGWEKVSCLERCPQFRSVLIEREVPLYNQDTNGAEESVIVSEVSSFQRLKCMQEW